MPYRFNAIVSLRLVTLFTCSAEPKTAKAAPPDPIVGKWIWDNGARVTITQDGKVIASNGGVATWKYLENKEVERKYEFIWDEGSSVQTLRLLQNGKKLEGKTTKGERTGADRSPVP